MIETSFYELRMKSVINVVDGSNLGNICDVIMEVCSGKIVGFVVPGKKKWYNFFKSCEDIFIPYHNICKIGVDSILVELTCTETKNFQTTSFSEVSFQKRQDCNKNPLQEHNRCPKKPNCCNPCEQQNNKPSKNSCSSCSDKFDYDFKNYLKD